MNRPAILIWLFLVAAAGGADRAEPVGKEVLVLISSRAEAYETALDGLRRQLHEAGLSTLIADASEHPPLRDTGVSARRYRAIVALGPEALSAVPGGVDAPLIATMILHSTAAHYQQIGIPIATAVTVNVPTEKLLENLHRLWPRRSRLGVIRNPARGDPEAGELEAAGRRCGLSVIAADCDRPEKLPAAWSRLAGSVDFILCFPDATLYNSATIKAIILSSLRTKTPVVGFSRGFVSAGAVMSTYPDYEAAGKRAGDALLGLMGGRPEPAEWPLRSWRTAVNTRIARMMDLRTPVNLGQEVTEVQ